MKILFSFNNYMRWRPLGQVFTVMQGNKNGAKGEKKPGITPGELNREVSRLGDVGYQRHPGNALRHCWQSL